MPIDVRPEAKPWPFRCGKQASKRASCPWSASFTLIDDAFADPDYPVISFALLDAPTTPAPSQEGRALSVLLLKDLNPFGIGASLAHRWRSLLAAD